MILLMLWASCYHHASIPFVLALANPKSGRAANTNSIRNNIRYRIGLADDVLPIAAVMAKELMNPFGISHRNTLLVATDSATGDRVGWAQVRSLGYLTVETNPSDTFVQDGDDGSALRRDTESSRSIERDVEEILWQEFEDDDSAEFPNGLASLPWTDEYQTASQSAKERVERREKMLQEELARRPRLWELSSVYVTPDFRRQGIGSELVKGVLELTRNKNLGNDVYALTLAKTVPWYEQLGFVQEEVIPKPMALEVAAGKVITKLIGEELGAVSAELDRKEWKLEGFNRSGGWVMSVLRLSRSSNVNADGRRSTEHGMVSAELDRSEWKLGGSKRRRGWVISVMRSSRSSNVNTDGRRSTVQGAVSAELDRSEWKLGDAPLSLADGDNERRTGLGISSFVLILNVGLILSHLPRVGDDCMDRRMCVSETRLPE
eukprot:scaffold9542_cov92-Cylindrotheca_fusiformis.AAC.4